jgi:hypothetical protein
MWDNKHRYEVAMNERDYKRSRALKMNTIGSAQVERGSPEGEDRISFELSTAIGGRIVNVRRYDNRKEQHNSTTYVIPNGEDVGSRVAKIINIELIK